MLHIFFNNIPYIIFIIIIFIYTFIIKRFNGLFMFISFLLIIYMVLGNSSNEDLLSKYVFVVLGVF